MFGYKASASSSIFSRAFCSWQQAGGSKPQAQQEQRALDEDLLEPPKAPCFGSVSEEGKDFLTQLLQPPGLQWLTVPLNSSMCGGIWYSQYDA